MHVQNDVYGNENVKCEARMSHHCALHPPNKNTRTTRTDTHEREGGGKPRIATNDKMVPWPIGASSSKKLKLRDKIKALFS